MKREPRNPAFSTPALNSNDYDFFAGEGDGEQEKNEQCCCSCHGSRQFAIKCV